MKLFDRGKNDFTLTKSGEILYRYACDLLDTRKKSIVEITGTDHKHEESLTIAASSVPCQYILPKLSVLFEKKFPMIKVSLRQSNSEQVCKDVYNYHSQLGVVGQIHSLPRLKYIPLLDDELVVAIPNTKDYEQLLLKEELLLSDLLEYRILLREEGSATRAILELEMAKAELGLDNFNRSVYDSQETIKQAVRQGMGITVISNFVVEDYREFGILSTKRLSNLKLQRKFYLVFHERRVLSPAAKNMQNFIISFF